MRTVFALLCSGLALPAQSFEDAHELVGVLLLERADVHTAIQRLRELQSPHADRVAGLHASVQCGD